MTHWKLFLAFALPGFFRSTILESLVKKPAAEKHKFNVTIQVQISMRLYNFYSGNFGHFRGVNLNLIGLSTFARRHKVCPISGKFDPIYLWMVYMSYVLYLMSHMDKMIALKIIIIILIKSQMVEWIESRQMQLLLNKTY